ncbi:MAG TPA: hypothetical protein VKE91_00460 [Blastocatellia bacterium]|nr:hypothetical protein [Blastocatellia bacterium]
MTTKQSASSRSAARGHTNTRGTKRRAITAKEFDALFDSGSDEIDQYLDWERVRQPGREVQRVNVDFPVDLLQSIDREANRIGVTRQAFIKLRLADTLRKLRYNVTKTKILKRQIIDNERQIADSLEKTEIIKRQIADNERQIADNLEKMQQLAAEIQRLKKRDREADISR